MSFLGIWNALLLYDREQSFYFHRLPSAAEYLSAALGVLVLGAAFLGLLQLARWIRGRWGRLWAAPVLFLIALLPANLMLNTISTRFADLRVRLLGVIGLRGIMLIFAAAVAASLFLLIRLRGRPVRIAALILAQFSLLIALEIGESIWRVFGARPADYADRTLAAIRDFPARRRIVWIIFDELDYRLAFPNRPASVAMPEFDRLRAQAVTATDAVSPARDTSVSVPSLLTGKQFNVTKGSGPTILYAGKDASSMEPIDVNSTIFSDVRRAGGNVAVAGWYLPYCRMFQADLSACTWYDNGNALNITGGSVANQIRSLFETSLFSPFGQSLTLQHAVQMVAGIRCDALAMVANRAFDLVFLHYPVPHAPHPYDRATGTFTRANSGFEGYLDSLALADVLLGEVRTEMTRAQAWDDATVLVTSDHPYRQSRQLDGKDDPRVPFLLKLPGQSAPVTYDRPLRTLVTRDLLGSVFHGEVTTPAGAVQWLSR